MVYFGQYKTKQDKKMQNVASRQPDKIRSVSPSCEKYCTMYTYWLHDAFNFMWTCETKDIVINKGETWIKISHGRYSAIHSERHHFPHCEGGIEDFIITFKLCLFSIHVSISLYTHFCSGSIYFGNGLLLFISTRFHNDYFDQLWKYIYHIMKNVSILLRFKQV